MLIRASLIGSALALSFIACTSGEDTSQDEATSCVRIEGADLGKRITVDVPSGDSTMAVTFISWLEKAGSPNEYVGFSLDASADFTVKAGYDKYSTQNSSWANPFGTTGTLVKAISYVDLCSASPIVVNGGEGFGDAGVDSGTDAGSDEGGGCNNDLGCDGGTGSGSDGSGGGSGSGEGSGSGSGSGEGSGSGSGSGCSGH